jgi:hypothetical protein
MGPKAWPEMAHSTGSEGVTTGQRGRFGCARGVRPSGVVAGWAQTTYNGRSE